MRRRGLVARLFLLVVLAELPAFGQTSEGDSAQEHVQRGIELRRKGEDAAALAEFERAHALAPSVRISAQIGLALQALGRWREAEEIELKVLSDTSDSWVGEHQDLLREAVTTCQHHLAWLSVDASVAGAELWVNGESAGKLPLANPVRVTAGAVVLEVRAEGYEPMRRTLDVPAGTQARESVVLVGNARPAGPGAAAGAVPFDVGASRRAAGWAAIVGGGVLVGGGVAAAIVSAQNAAIYNDDSHCFYGSLTRDQRCGSERGVRDVTLVTAIVALSLGVVGLGVGIDLVVVAPSRRSATRVTLECGLGLASASCGGRF
jgi:hypothetical protein